MLDKIFKSKAFLNWSLVLFPPLAIFVTWKKRNDLPFSKKVLITVAAVIWSLILITGLYCKLASGTASQKESFSHNMIDPSQATSSKEKEPSPEDNELKEDEGESSGKETPGETLPEEITEPSDDESTQDADPSENFDELQKFYSNITLDMNRTDFEQLLSHYQLFYKQRERDEGVYEYIIAMSDGVAQFMYATEDGDAVFAEFDTTRSSKIRYALYDKRDSKRSGLIYNYGAYEYFTDNTLGEHNGYYALHDYFTDIDKTSEPLLLEFSDTEPIQTNYYKRESAKEVVLEVIDGIIKK